MSANQRTFIEKIPSNVLQANSLDPAQNGKWEFSTLHHKHDRDIGFSDRYEFSMREYRRDYFTFCEFNFKLDKIARIKSTDDYSENISEFFGSDDDIFVENLFDFDWPDMDGILELYDIIAPPSDIEIKTAGNNSGLGGRSSGRFQINLVRPIDRLDQVHLSIWLMNSYGPYDMVHFIWSITWSTIWTPHSIWNSS